MFSRLKLIYKNIKTQHKKAFLESRFFNGVEFRNPKLIEVATNSNIEKDSILLVTDPIDLNAKKIIIESFCWIGRNVEIQTVYNSKIIIKDYASVQDRCKLLGSVSIGKYSILAPDVFISSGNHYFKNNPYLTIREQDILKVGSVELFEEEEKPVVIEEDCWLGKNVFIKAGTYIGRGAIIATNSIVTKDIEPYSVNVGSPIIKVKNRLDFIPPKEISAFSITHLPYFYSGFEHFKPGINIEDLIKKNSGIASENISMIVLENFNFNKISIEGFSKQIGVLKIYINGNESLETNLNSDNFSFDIENSIAKKMYSKYELLPEIMSKYLCIQFEFITHSNEKHNFYLSKIKAS